MKITRRTFIKSSAVAGGALAATQLFDRRLLTFASKESSALAALAGEEWVPTTCWIGKQECGMLARKIGGRVVKFEGHPEHPRNRGTLCPKGMAQIMAVYDYNRVKTPLKRTNAKGIPGKWQQISWDQALTETGDAVKEVIGRDKRLLIWQKGRSKAKKFYDKAFVAASGATKLGHGAYCSDAGYRACEYTVGLHGVLHPDFRHTRYLLAIGWNATNAGGNKFCQITWHQQMIEAQERGMKIVALDPSRRGTGPFADEWIPVKPSTDIAFMLAVCNVLIAKGHVDSEYLVKHTNAPYLVKADGAFLRVGDEVQVWNPATNGPVPVDTEGVTPTLDGEFAVDGTPVKTAFRVLKEHVASATPAWAAEICGVPAEQIQQAAEAFGKNAMIGSTTVVDGVKLPYRPVGIMAYHAIHYELGFQAVRAALIASMLVGAIEAVGGQRVDFTYKVHKNFEKFGELKVGDPPYNIYLKDSKFFPINSGNPSVMAQVTMDPGKYGVDYVPEVMIIHMTNPLLSFVDQKAFMDAYKKYKFVAVIDPWLSETADYFADIVLPAATIEKYEGPMGITDQYTDATALRIPPMEPLFESRGEIDIYIDLCEKAGILFGEDGYIAQVNKQLKLKDAYALDLNTRPDVRDIFDRWARSEGISQGIGYFEKNGIKVKGPVSAKKFYGYAQDPPFNGIRHRLYGESLLTAQKAMEEKGAPETYWRQYTALPTWMVPTMDQSPEQYDLYLISRKQIEFKQSRSTFVPLLNELAPEQGLEMNPAAAKAREIEDGDEVWVESHNAVTGEARRVKTKAVLREIIRPDTVSLSHHYGFWVNPITKEQGPTPNSIFYSGEGYVSNTADQSFQVKVRVFKA